MFNKFHKSNNYIKCYEFIMIHLYNVILLFYEKINRHLIVSFGIIWFIWFVFVNIKKWSFLQILSFLMCIYVPTSFVSILGTYSGVFPVTWFNLVIILAYIYILFKGFKMDFYFFSPLIMLFFGVVSLWISVNITDTLKQLLTIFLFLISFFIGEQVSKNANEEFVEKLKNYYIVSVFAFSVVVVIQKICVDYLQIAVGHFDIYGSGRIVYAGLMSDYSFASLYIATGAILIVIDYIDNKLINTFRFITCGSFLLISMLIINARTGLFACVVTIGLYLFFKLVQGNLKSLFILFGTICIFPYIIHYVVDNRGGQSLIDDSGRATLNYLALEVFLEKPMFGVGLGISNWNNITGNVIPHNMIVQYLAQLGIVGSIVLYSSFFVFAFKYLKYKSKFFWVLLTVLIGAMFIPDIFNSRFLAVLVILTIVSSVIIQNQKVETELMNKPKIY